MKITLKTLNQKTIHVDFDVTKTVFQLKNYIVEQSDVGLEVENLQLIYAGKVMQNEDLVSLYGIEENKFIVLMGKKVINQTVENSNIQCRNEDNSQSTNIDTSTEYNISQTQMLDEDRVRDLISMGYEEVEVRDALRASFNCPERAIEYLITGIPPQIQNNSYSPSSDGITTIPLIDSNYAQDSVSSLSRNPHYEQMRSFIRQHPEFLPVILSRLSETDSEALNAIRDNQNEFLRALNLNSDNLNATVESVTQVELSEADNNAIERLSGLGFERELVVQVFIACDKNEELAADLLFRQMDRDD